MQSCREGPAAAQIFVSGTKSKLLKFRCWQALHIPHFEMQHAQIEGWAQDYGNSNVFLKPLFRGNLDPFVNNANLGAIAHTSNGT